MNSTTRAHLLATALILSAAAGPLLAHDDDPKRIGRVAPLQGPVWKRNASAAIQGGGGGSQDALGFASDGVELMQFFPAGSFGRRRCSDTLLAKISILCVLE